MKTTPIIIAGGPSVYNPEPYAAFFDAILIGEGEESLLETCQLHRRLRDEGVPRAQIVEQLGIHCRQLRAVAL